MSKDPMSSANTMRNPPGLVEYKNHLNAKNEYTMITKKSAPAAG